MAPFKVFCDQNGQDTREMKKAPKWTELNEENLHGLNRRDLQALAKQHGIKANSKSHEIIKELLTIVAQKEGNKRKASEMSKKLNDDDVSEGEMESRSGTKSTPNKRLKKGLIERSVNKENVHVDTSGNSKEAIKKKKVKKVKREEQASSRTSDSAQKVKKKAAKKLSFSSSTRVSAESASSFNSVESSSSNSSSQSLLSEISTQSDTARQATLSLERTKLKRIGTLAAGQVAKRAAKRLRNFELEANYRTLRTKAGVEAATHGALNAANNIELENLRLLRSSAAHIAAENGAKLLQKAEERNAFRSLRSKANTKAAIKGFERTLKLENDRLRMVRTRAGLEAAREAERRLEEREKAQMYELIGKAGKETAGVAHHKAQGRLAARTAAREAQELQDQKALRCSFRVLAEEVADRASEKRERRVIHGRVLREIVQVSKSKEYKSKAAREAAARGQYLLEQAEERLREIKRQQRLTKNLELISERMDQQRHLQVLLEQRRKEVAKLKAKLKSEALEFEKSFKEERRKSIQSRKGRDRALTLEALAVGLELEKENIPPVGHTKKRQRAQQKKLEQAIAADKDSTSSTSSCTAVEPSNKSKQKNKRRKHKKANR